MGIVKYLQRHTSKHDALYPFVSVRGDYDQVDMVFFCIINDCVSCFAFQNLCIDFHPLRTQPGLHRCKILFLCRRNTPFLVVD